jgi:hypothetical protein
MGLDLANYEKKARLAVKAFWGGRESAAQKQLVSGKVDQGARGAVTGGKNMDGFVQIVIDLVKANGLAHAQIHLERKVLTLPGFFRPTKLWDLLIINDGKLIAALECKSQVGPSFGNNFNNRTEEAIGTAHDFWTAYRESAFGEINRPFVGWLMLVEDAPASRAPVKDSSPHFAVFPEFKSACYLERYNILCKKLVQEQLYTSAAIMTSPNKGAKTGEFSAMSEMTSLKAFVTSLAGHIAAAAAQQK